MPGFSQWANDSRFKALALLVLVLSVFALGSYSYFTLKQAKYVFGGPTNISVSGKGEIFAKPDIATFTFSVHAEEKDATTAQQKGAEAINKVIAFLKEKGIDEKDIKTSNYSLQPKYEYTQGVCTQWSCPPGKQNLVGYTLDQSVEVKVRKTETVGDVFTGITENGGMNVYGPTFTIDDDEKLKAEARAEAIANAKVKAEELAKQLGVRLVRMTSYWENENSGYPVPMYDKAMSYGGDAMTERATVAPSIPSGENKIVSTVTLNYEVR
jgi:uncharacterized protein YggE